MRKIILCIFVICVSALLTVPAFADVMPPHQIDYPVTVGDAPITRYRLQYDENGRIESVEEAGTIPAGEVIHVKDEITINGKRYGKFYVKERQSDSDGTTESGAEGTSFPVSIWNNRSYWVSYYFLLADVVAPTERTTDSTNPPTTGESSSAATTENKQTVSKESGTSVTTQAQKTTVGTEPETEITEPGTTEPEPPPETTAGQTSAAVDDVTDETYDRSPTQTVFLCIGAAAVVALTAAVTLVWIRRKKHNP